MSPAAAARAWLDARRPEPPRALRARMLEALAEAPSESPGGGGADPVPSTLAEAALGRLRAALVAGPRRAAALDLLAADALLTYAFEAAAEAGPEAVAGLARSYGAGRLAELLPRLP